MVREDSPAERAGARERAGLRRTLIVVASVIGGLLLMGYVLSHVMAASACRVPEVSQWRQHTTEDDTITLRVPADWKLTEGSAQGIKTRLAVERSGFVAVHVTGSDVMSWVGDIAKTAGGGGSMFGVDMPAVEGRPPEQKVHALFREEFEQRYSGYSEGPMESLTVGNSPACKTDITFKKRCGAVSVRMRGVRITALGSQRGYTIVAYCPARSYSDFEPLVAEILADLRIQ